VSSVLAQKLRRRPLTRPRPARSALSLLEDESDPAVREALRVQMMEFGRTPRRLFRRPHPPRRAAATGGAAGAGLWRCLHGRQLPPAAPRAANPSRPEVVATVRSRSRSLAERAQVALMRAPAACSSAAPRRTAAAHLCAACAAACVPAVAHASAPHSRRCGHASPALCQSSAYGQLPHAVSRVICM